MVQSIELLLDEATEAAIRGSWAALAAAGVPSLADSASESNRPHVTVAVAVTGLEAAAAAVGSVVAGLAESGLPTVVGAPLLFGGARDRWVLVRQVVVGRALLELHAAVHDAIGGAASEVSEQTLPDAWSPHVTLARRLPGPLLPSALAAVDVEPVVARFVGVRLWDSVLRTVRPL